MEAGVAGALYAAETLLEGAVALARGIYYPTLPLKATFSAIKGASLPRSSHSISVVKGRAYIFGGETEAGQLADNGMHIVILPSSGVTEADYTHIPARPAAKDGAVPKSRKDHSAVVIGDEIYIFGGQMEEEEVEGRLWVFDTISNSWSYIDPAPDSQHPQPRFLHAAASSEEPGPKDARVDYDVLPQQPPDPAKYVPEPPEPGSWGTIFIHAGRAGRGGEGELLNDAWTFDVKSRTWSELPTPPGPARYGAALVVAGDKLCRYGGHDGRAETGGRIEWLEISGAWKFGRRGSAFGNLALSSLIGAWQEGPHGEAGGPGARSGAGLVDVTTGQGRDYLLLVGGAGPLTRAQPDDVWAFQSAPAGRTAASVKDATRHAIKKDTQEAQWAEVEYRYEVARGETVQGELPGRPGVKGVGPRAASAAAKGTEIDGASVVVWGGKDPGGRTLGDGWLITVER